MSSVGTKLGDECCPEDDCDDPKGICDEFCICPDPFVELSDYCGKLCFKVPLS